MGIDIFDAISDGNRRFLLEELRREPSTVNQLAKKLPVSRPAVSQHLKVLLDANLVDVEADGTKRIYSLNSHGFTRLNIWIDQFWDE
ncbi:MAG: metalloregulator ArsR/SmtB family transcription factor [Pseudomonadota bacterium]